jgi:hypothetical protein
VAGLTPAGGSPLPVVTDHAVERYLQRVRGVLDAKPEIAGRVARAWAAGLVEPGEKANVRVRDVDRADIVYVCRHDRPRGELIVVTLWDERGYSRPMSFLDKAKKLAEQAQTKLDEAQKQFNDRQSGGQQSSGPAPEYDSAGRPVQRDPAARRPAGREHRPVAGRRAAQAARASDPDRHAAPRRSARRRREDGRQQPAADEQWGPARRVTSPKHRAARRGAGRRKRVSTEPPGEGLAGESVCDTEGPCVPTKAS